MMVMTYHKGQTTSGSAGFQGTPDSGRGGPGMDGDRKGLGAIASGVRTPMDKYGAPSPDGGGPSARGGMEVHLVMQCMVIVIRITDLNNVPDLDQ